VLGISCLLDSVAEPLANVMQHISGLCFRRWYPQWLMAIRALDIYPCARRIHYKALSALVALKRDVHDGGNLIRRN
jgi:hypothetical protein